MAFKKIDVDEEVFTALQRKAIPFKDHSPNDVLRRLLLNQEVKLSTGQAGDLMRLLDAGRLEVGDKLVHYQPRKRRTFSATVTADGHIELDDGRIFAAPSPALKACVGSEINGWDHWIVERTGQRLQDHRHG